jgi:uncharacterized protein YjbJ (UPF0337 family)
MQVAGLAEQAKGKVQHQVGEPAKDAACAGGHRTCIDGTG